VAADLPARSDAVLQADDYLVEFTFKKTYIYGNEKTEILRSHRYTQFSSLFQVAWFDFRPFLLKLELIGKFRWLLKKVQIIKKFLFTSLYT